MQNARIFLIEGNVAVSDFLCGMFRQRGNEVVSRAFTFEEALEIIESGKLERKAVNVAIVVGNLLSTELHERIFGGPIIEKAIKEKNPKIVTISYSRRTGAEFGDIHVYKDSVCGEIFDTVQAA
jgi:hypothetical protein